MAELKLFKASAGSGKTFQLTYEYLLLALDYPFAFSHILAVTFTNKAATEMKNRILQELHLLASQRESKHLLRLCDSMKRTQEAIRHDAAIVLKALLHNYSRFSVSTIDHFFQRVLQSFLRELGLQTGLTIELNNMAVLDEAVNRLFTRIDSDSNLREWLISFAEEKIELGQTWDFHHNIKELGQQVFTETYHAIGSALQQRMHDKEFLKQFMSETSVRCNQIKQELVSAGRAGLDLIEKHGLTINDFRLKERGFISYFVKLAEAKFELPNKTTSEARNDVTKWYSQTSPRQKQIEEIYPLLNPLLSNAIEAVIRHLPYLVSAQIVRSQIYVMGILADLSQEINGYCRDKDIFLLSNSSKLLKDVISDNDTPFIYEKQGQYYHHYMIDEFQDTSQMQWNNFMPLIAGSMSENHDNLLVGDIKQSIYRWRNSDWNVFAHKVEEAFSSSNLRKIGLKVNYRSAPLIIKFNNSLFDHCSSILSSRLAAEMEEENMLSREITTIYSDAVQEIQKSHENNNGYISIRFFKDTPERKWSDTAIEHLPEVLQSLQDKGVALRDTAILVRTKDDGRIISSFLMEYGQQHAGDKYRYEFISEEFLFLTYSAAVCMILAILRYLVDPDDSINCGAILHLSRDMSTIKPDQEPTFIDPCKQAADIIKNAGFISPSVTTEQLIQMPVNEIIERIIRIFGMQTNEQEVAYLIAFQDRLSEFQLTRQNDIYSFLNWWEENSSQFALSAADEQDAIRIMTIHKAKGLEFQAILVPFCEWNLDNDTNPTIVWCKTEASPFNGFERIPLRYNKKLITSYFKDDYYREKQKAYIDNLNLLYVAFTRPKANLIAFCKAPEKEDFEIRSISSLLFSAFTKTHTGKDALKISLTDAWNDEEQFFKTGTITAKENKTVYANEFVLTGLHISDRKREIRYRRYGDDFFVTDPGITHPLNYGKVMHEAFMRIRSKKDIPAVIQALVFEGIIPEARADELTQIINKYLSLPDITGWFEDGLTIIAENEIILPGGATMRPDRVIIQNNKATVIDYKFGKHKNEEHRQQVARYCEQMKLMGYTDVKGYLWYVTLQEIFAVNN